MTSLFIVASLAATSVLVMALSPPIHLTGACLHKPWETPQTDAECHGLVLVYSFAGDGRGCSKWTGCSGLIDKPNVYKTAEECVSTCGVPELDTNIFVYATGGSLQRKAKKGEKAEEAEDEKKDDKGDKKKKAKSDKKKDKDAEDEKKSEDAKDEEKKAKDAKDEEKKAKDGKGKKDKAKNKKKKGKDAKDEKKDKKKEDKEG